MGNSEKIGFIEKNFLVINKEDNLVPMKLFKAQKHFIEKKTRRNICLKGRQVGFSSGVEADNSEDLFNLPYQRQSIITHDTETSEFLFQNVQRFYRNLPWNKGKPEDMMAPKHDWNSGTRMRFPILDSYIYIDSAKSDTISIGHTLNRCHLSEVAKWPDRKARQLWADVTQTVSRNGIVTGESTPQGKFGLFYEEYQAAKDGKNGFTAFFYPWWWNEDYVANPDEYMTPKKAEMIAEILCQSTASFLKDEKSLAEYNDLSPAQLSFRRWKIGEIKILYFQEYPENDIDCWLSSEMSIIEPSSLRPYFNEIRPGMIHGNTTVWKGPVGGRNYIIGADVASGSARDFSVASVIDTRTLEYVARIRGKINTDMFAEDLMRLGHEYNDALIAVERIGHGHSVLKILLDKNYPNIYYHTDYDDAVNVNVTDAGWKTSMKTKPLMISTMITTFRSHDLISWSENLLREASAVTWEGGVDSKVKTLSGEHDDEFMAVAIALQVRESTPILEAANIYKPIVYAKVF